ncbi:MAG TPA: ANTAR domain-containing protein [Rhodocyclaceae bacterium]|nr:ANTAR domain-containing protein [Rhodocyclaceae bacterium]
MLRVLVVDESRMRAADICAGLALAGHQVAAILPSALDLADQVGKLRPDVILIETDSPSRDTLEHLGVVNREAPRPVVIFARESDADVIRAAVRAGVSAYVVDGLDPQRIQPVIEVARARFEDYQALRRELADATQKLSERKLVERAKGILMKSRNMDEDAAYKALRRLAMDRGKPLAAVARDVVDMAQLLL